MVKNPCHGFSERLAEQLFLRYKTVILSNIYYICHKLDCTGAPSALVSCSSPIFAWIGPDLQKSFFSTPLRRRHIYWRCLNGLEACLQYSIVAWHLSDLFENRNLLLRALFLYYWRQCLRRAHLTLLRSCSRFDSKSCSIVSKYHHFLPMQSWFQEDWMRHNGCHYHELWLYAQHATADSCSPQQVAKKSWLNSCFQLGIDASEQLSHLMALL